MPPRILGCHGNVAACLALMCTMLIGQALVDGTSRVHGQEYVETTIPNDGSIRQSSLLTAESVVHARRSAGAQPQIRVTVQYLLMDDATRSAIYEGLDPKSLRRAIQYPAAVGRMALDESVAEVGSAQQSQSPSRTTTCTLDAEEFAELFRTVVASPNSKVNVAPKIFALEDKEVEMTDLVQRPFVIDIYLDGDVVKPSIHVLEDGTRLRLLARRIPSQVGAGQTLELSCELTVMRVVDVGSDQVYGIKDEPLSVQVPTQQVTTAIARCQLDPGETLMIDPHVRQDQVVRSESSVPLLGKIPYVGKTFKQTGAGVVGQRLILLLQPALETD